MFKELFGGGQWYPGAAGGRGYPGRRASGSYRAAARKEAAEHDAAFRWGKGADGNCAVICHPELKTVTVLSAGRNRGGVGRQQRRKICNYLHKLTAHTQFIVITHRRGTMEAADRLYGITMQEKGVSTLVSVNLIDKDLT